MGLADAFTVPGIDLRLQRLALREQGLILGFKFGENLRKGRPKFLDRLLCALHRFIRHKIG